MDRTRKRKADVAENVSTPSKRQKGPDETPESVTAEGLKLVESMKNAKDKTGRSVSELFLELPRKRDVPDYFDVIKLPIAIATIERKLRKHEYSTLSEVESDCKRMVANAKQYNDDESEVFGDAERMRKLVHNWMKVHNPAHKDPSYVPVATPIPDGAANGDTNGEAAADEDNEAASDGEAVKRESGPKRPTIVLSKGRRDSEMQAKQSIESDPKPTKQISLSNDFQGKTFGQVQEQIMNEFIQWKDEDDLAEFQPFVNLPSRSITDYYQLIKRPLCLKMVIKRARGQHGREAATGVTDYKTWDAFEDDVSLIWKNAQEYNEDGSEMYELAEKFKELFLARLAEVKQKVDEPQGMRIKLNARPKPKLHLGSKPTTNGQVSSPGISVDNEALERQKQLVQTGANGIQSQQSTPRPQLESVISSDTRTGSVPPVIKTEISVASPLADGSHLPTTSSEAKPSPIGSMPPPGRVPSASPHPANPVGPAPYVPALAPPLPNTFADVYSRTKPVDEALLPNIHLCSHAQLNLTKPFKMDIAASPEYTHQSVTIMLPVTQYHLQVTPTVSQQLSSGRQYKLFVTVNGVRSSPSTRPTTASGELTNGVEKKPAYDIPLNTGVNRVEVEIVAVTGRGGTLEQEKTTIFANLMRH